MAESNTDREPAGEPGGGERPAVRHVDVRGGDVGARLDQFLMRLLPGLPKSRVFRLVRRGEVRVNGKRAVPEQRLAARDVVRVPPIWPEAEGAAHGTGDALGALAGAVLFEDERVLVLDKPARAAVHGGIGVEQGVIDALRSARPGEYLELAHRLDRDTSGCLLVAKSAEARGLLIELFRAESVEKRYLALVSGAWELGQKRVDAPLRTDLRVAGERTVKVQSGGKPALSEFRPERAFGRRATLVEVALHTGRMHQIRVHAAYLGHPVAGDAKYGDARFNAELRALGLRRTFLHARSVAFAWPEGGPVRVQAPLPAELALVLERLGAQG